MTKIDKIDAMPKIWFHLSSFDMIQSYVTVEEGKLQHQSDDTVEKTQKLAIDIVQL